MTDWTDRDVPDQSGRTAVVTGGTSGLGFRVAEVLAQHGARVILTSRDPERAAVAVARVADSATGPHPEGVTLDLTDLGSVREAAQRIRSLSNDRVHLLVNNAGIMAPPLSFSAQGIESQWAANMIGPAALTWQVLPAIEATPGSRVVTVPSLAHFLGKFDANRLRADARGERYSPFFFYARTKLANLLFARELERHFRRAGAPAMSVAAHPGLAETGVAANVFAHRSRAWQKAAVRSYAVIAQPVEQAAIPLLYAATAPEVLGTRYYGPSWLVETRGPPTNAARSPASRSEGLGRALLEFLETSTGLTAPH